MPNKARSAAPLTAPAIAAGYLRMREASRFLSISPRTLTNWMRRGLVPYSKPAVKVTLFAVSDLHKLVGRFRIESAS